MLRIISGFLRFALNKAFDVQTEGSLSEALVNLDEDPYSEDEQYGDVVLGLVDEICRETNMRNFRTTARGMDTDDLQMPVLNQRSVVRWREA